MQTKREAGAERVKIRERRLLFGVRLAAHVSNGLKSRIHPVVGRI